MRPFLPPLRFARRRKPRSLRAGVFTASLLLLAACSTYETKPLSPQAVEAALQPASPDAVKVAAASLHHPLLPPLVIDGRDGFTPDEVAVMTVVASPRLRALRDQRGVAEAQVTQAGLLPNPQIAYTLDRLAGNNEPGLVDGGSLGLSWEVTYLLGHRQRVTAAKATASALDLDVAWQEWQAAQAARLSAYRILSLEARFSLARDAEHELAEAVAEARKAYALRDKTTADVAAVTEAWSVAQDARFAVEQELNGERVGLRLALGLPPEAALQLKPDAFLPDISVRNFDAPSLLDGLETRRLDLVALTLGYESADASLRAAVRAQFPKIGLSFGKARDTSDVKTLSFGVTVDLPLFDRNQGQIAAGQATRQQLFDEYVARVAEARADVGRILANIAILNSQLRTVAEELPQLQQIANALDRAMATRNADTQAWRDAHNALLGRRIEQAKMNQDLLDLYVALELATGRPLLATVSLP